MAGETSDALRRFNESLGRLNQNLAEQAERDRRELEQDARSQYQIDRQTISDMRSRFDPIFARCEEQCPQAAADEAPASFEKRLMKIVQQKLSPSDERPLPDSPTTSVGDVARLEVGQLTRTARQAFQPLFHAAAEIQARSPHTSTLPSDGSLVSRVEVDDSGMKTRRWFGTESFIKALSTPGRQVERIFHPVHGVLFGPKYPERR